MFERMDDDVDPDKVAMAFGPGVVDREIRQAINMCWMTMPRQRRSLDEVEKEMRRLLDRALRDMREDEERRRPSTSS